MSSFKKGLDDFFKKIATYEISEKNTKKAIREFKLLLLQNDVSLEIANQITKELMDEVKGKRARHFTNMSQFIREVGKELLLKLVTPKNEIDFIEILKDRRKLAEKNAQKEPLVVIVAGINGTGKTTSIAKLAYILKKEKFLVILAASDTFRSGAQEQLEEHAKKVGVKIIKGKYGGDSAAVAYDAIAHAKSKYADIVLIDTAGRMGTNVDLMGEMKKLKRVTEPDYILLVIDALAGNDATNQARDFHKGIGIDGIIITKMDSDTKGGALISVTKATGGVPVCYIGTGQKYSDLERFDPEKYINNLFS